MRNHKLASANFSLQKVETNSNYLKTSILKHTSTHTVTNWPKIMSHRSKIIYLVEIENVRQIVAERLTLEILNDWNCPKILLYPLSTTCGVYSTRKKLCSKDSTTNRMLPNTVWVPGSGRRRQALGVMAPR